MAYTKDDLDADLDILSYCFADQVKAKIEKRKPSQALLAKMNEILPRVREHIAEDEKVSFSVEIAKETYKQGETPPFGKVRAYIEKICGKTK